LIVSYYGCASRYGHLLVFLLLVFVVLYCNTCANIHGYMYVIFDILFYMLSVYTHQSTPVLVPDSDGSGVTGNAEKSVKTGVVQVKLMYLLVPNCSAKEVSGNSQCLHLIR